MAIDISAQTRRVVYTGSAGTGPYAFAFNILVNTDIAVYFNNTELTLTTDYTVAISGDGTGSVTIVVGTNVPTTPDADDRITLIGNRTIERTTDFTTGGPLFATTLNDEFDSLTIFTQQNLEQSNRSLRAPNTDPTTINMELPINTVRANKTLAFDANGDPVIGEIIGDNRGNWAAGVAYNKRDLVKDTSNSNVYICQVAHTSSGSLPISGNADSAKWDLVVDAAAAAAAQAAAEAAQAAAEVAQTAAELAETNAETAETNAASSASAASTSATNAASSASSASSSASTASTAATNAGTSATNAATSASAASSSASSASSSASTATTQAGIATTQAGIATTQAGNASTSASNASTSESNAATSESNAATSESNAATSESNAATSASDAQAIKDSIDEFYLGAQASNPTLDNNGNPVTAGDWYFNTVANETRIYNGSTWQVTAISSAGFLTSANNLSDIASSATAQTNLGGTTIGKALFVAVSASAAQQAMDVEVGVDVQAYDATIVVDADIGVSVQGYDVDTAKTDVAQTFTTPQRGTSTTDNDLSFDLSVTNNFTCTPSGTGTLTFTNHTAGQSGYVLLINTGGYAISAAATTKVTPTFLATVSTAGTYLVAYYDDGTNAYCTTSGIMA
jgi:hypothetical protein